MFLFLLCLVLLLCLLLCLLLLLGLLLVLLVLLLQCGLVVGKGGAVHGGVKGVQAAEAQVGLRGGLLATG